MASEVSNALLNSKILLCEAGTGTAKTFAYLVPALLSSQQTIVSTGTRNLQDQLFYKDLPLIVKALEPVLQRKVNISLLKGRSNYVCLYRLEQSAGESWYDEQTQSDLHRLKKHLGQTRFADRAEFTMLQEQSAIWPMVTSTTENCLGAHCPEHERCYVLKAREQALSADIVIVNHHLLMADLSLKKNALGDILPDALNYIIDEAHQLPDIAGQFFSQHISSKQIKGLLHDVRKELKNQLSSGESFKHLSEEINRLLDEVTYVFSKLVNHLVKLAPVNEILEHFAHRAEQLLSTFNTLGLSEQSHKQNDTEQTNIHWFECSRAGFEIHSTPLMIGEQFKAHIAQQKAAWVFTSATLTINTNGLIDDSLEQVSEQDRLAARFNYFETELGLNQASFACFDSPFNYSKQAVLYLPPNMPMPDDPNYTRALIKAVLPLIHRLKGQ